MKQYNIFGEIDEMNDNGKRERTENEKANLEWNILIGLFRATCEQQTMLIGETKQHAKLIFNRWVKEGQRLMKVIEKESNDELLNEMTELMEETANKLREL